MGIRTLAHLSDLHIGRSQANSRAAMRLLASLLESGVDHVVVTGDVTHRGRADELEEFRRIFRPVAPRMTVVPGNHDRCGPAGDALMAGARVVAREAPGLYLVRVDSTAPHNRASFRAHGQLDEETLEAVAATLDRAPRGALRAVLLHHHPIPQPEESVAEWFATFLGWPHAAELPRGLKLLERALGRSDLILHGHKHVPRYTVWGQEMRAPLHVCNAGSSTELGRARVFEHEAGQLVAPPRWLDADRAPAAARLSATLAPGQLTATG